MFFSFLVTKNKMSLMGSVTSENRGGWGSDPLRKNSITNPLFFMASLTSKIFQGFYWTPKMAYTCESEMSKWCFCYTSSHWDSQWGCIICITLVFEYRLFPMLIINRPGVAGALLQTALSLINNFTDLTILFLQIFKTS